MTLEELQNQPKCVRVLASTNSPIDATRAMIGGEYEVHHENHYNNTIALWSANKTENWIFNRSDVQFLTPVKFEGRKIGIGDSVLLDEGWRTVYDYFYRDGKWALVSVGKGGELQYDCYVICLGDINDHRPLQIVDPAKLKWQQEMERLKEVGRKNGWE